MNVELFKRLKDSRNEIERIDDLLKEKKSSYEELMQMCVDEMLQEGVENTKIDGTTFSLNVLERPSIKEPQKFFGYLRRQGFGDLIVVKRAVNYQTLGKWYRNYLADHPEKETYIRRYLNIFTDKKIVFRGLKNGK